MTVELRMDVLHEEMGSGFTDMGVKVNAQGKGFVAVSNSNPNNQNETYVEVYILRNDGQPLSQEPQYRIRTNGQPDQDKMDAMNLARSGDDLWAFCGTHKPGPGPRPLRIEAKKIPGAFIGMPMETDEDGAGLTVVPISESEVDVDYGRIESIVDFVVKRIVGADQNDSLVNKITTGNQNMRPALRSLAEQGVKNLMTENDPDAVAYRAALANFIVETLYQPVLNAIWLDLVKMITGSEQATGYDAARLNAAFRAMLRNPAEGEEPTE